MFENTEAPKLADLDDIRTFILPILTFLEKILGHSDLREYYFNMLKTQMMVVILIVLGWTASASAQLRVMHYNIAGYQGDDAAIKAVLAAMHADNKMGWAQPVDIFLFNEVNNTAWPKIIAAVNAAAPAGVTYTAGTYTSASGETSASGAQAMFYRLLMVIQTLVQRWWCTMATHKSLSKPKAMLQQG